MMMARCMVDFFTVSRGPTPATRASRPSPLGVIASGFRFLAAFHYLIHPEMPRQLIGALLLAFAIAQRPFDSTLVLSLSKDERVAQDRPDAGAAFDAFWAADSPAAASRLADDIVKSGVTFDDAYR